MSDTSEAWDLPAEFDPTPRSRPRRNPRNRRRASNRDETPAGDDDEAASSLAEVGGMGDWESERFYAGGGDPGIAALMERTLERELGNRAG